MSIDYHNFYQYQEKTPEESIFFEESSVFQVQPEENNFLTYGHLDHNFTEECIHQEKCRSTLTLFNAVDAADKEGSSLDHEVCAVYKKHACRKCKRKSRTFKATIPPLDVLNNIQPIIYGLTDKQLAIFDCIIYFCKSFAVAHPSHQMIADYVGCHVSCVQKTIDKLLKIGLIGQVAHLVRGKANEYSLSSIWAWGKVKSKVAHLFKNLSNFFIEQLLSLNSLPKEESMPCKPVGIPNINLNIEQDVAILLGASNEQMDCQNPPPDPSEIKKAAEIADVHGTAG